MADIIINTPQVTIIEQVPQELLDRVSALEEGSAEMATSVQELQTAIDDMQGRTDDFITGLESRIDQLEQDSANQINPGDLDPLRDDVRAYRAAEAEAPAPGEGETPPGGGEGETPPGGEEPPPAP